ncbi:MAG: hypothetical protein HUK20_06135 [Fibrobacter sp.]|nr:hypothetical protein [Fibrobacter sp.]
MYPVTGRTACHLDRKVTDLAFGLKYSAGSKEELGMMIVHAFAEMQEYDFDKIVEQTLYNVVRIGNEGEGNVRVTSDNVYDFFVGDIDGLYGLLTQIWEVYELTPFKKARTLNTGA